MIGSTGTYGSFVPTIVNNKSFMDSSVRARLIEKRDALRKQLDTVRKHIATLCAALGHGSNPCKHCHNTNPTLEAMLAHPIVEEDDGEL